MFLKHIFIYWLLSRDRLGIPSNEQIIVDDFSRRNHEKSNKLSELTEQLEKCQDELLSYRLEVDNFL